MNSFSRAFRLGSNNQAYGGNLKPLVRPDIEPVDFYDEHGEVMHNLERFRPLHLVAAALVAYLVDEFDATVERIEPTAGDSRFFGGVEMVVRVVPKGEQCASLTFTFRGLPGISIAAGRWHEFPFPVCGCDACAGK